ncbi:MAG: hypothetical protein IJS02_05235 [Bacteroidales bacterium]|nr:hypothetical protein [Bacteroidales bacterium]
MKRILTTLVFSLAALVIFAQNVPQGMRAEIASVNQEDNVDSRTYTIFKYQEEDGTVNYYMSLGRSFNIISIVSDIGTSTLDHVDETCIYMGQSVDDVFEALDKLLEVSGEDVGTVVTYPCRLVDGIGRITGESTATCTVVKRFLQNKRLNFQFQSGRNTASVDMTPATIKSLRWTLNVSNKINPQ